jgi:mRNA deadenylase 3'-5' endonuclease subunit Ccr4
MILNWYKFFNQRIAIITTKTKTIIRTNYIPPLKNFTTITNSNKLLPTYKKMSSICYSWAARGTCPRGDKCQFDHPIQQLATTTITTTSTTPSLPNHPPPTPYRPWSKEVQQSKTTTPSTTSPTLKFSILSYNTLAESLVDASHQTCKDPKFLKSTHRYPLIFHQLDLYKTDIYCLQEIDEQAFHQIFQPTLLNKGYKGFHKKRTGEHSDGVCIFYKEENWKCLHVVPIELKVNGDPILDRDNVAIIFVLEHIQSSIQIAVINCHLLFNANRGDVKFAQMFRILQFLNSVIETFPKCQGHILWCGDFNTVKFSPLYMTLIGRMAYEELLEFDRRDISGQHLGRYSKNNTKSLKSPVPRNMGDITSLILKFQFDSSYRVVSSSGELPFSSVNRGFCETVDYIMFSTKGLQPTSTLLLPTTGVQHLRHLPNMYEPSDHICIGAKFCVV